MIIFHEGLPRSGKSYEAVVKHIIPSLQSGRPVYSNINGLYEGAEKLSTLIDKPVEYIQSLIHQLTDDQVYKLYEVVPKDAMICLDEIQNYYPSGGAKIPKEQIKYVAEHGHHGHDIILMGQSFADVAPLWRRRTQRKILFFKKTAVGQPDKYTWVAYEANAPEKFQKISSGSGEYDSKYFGTYKSHQDGTKNTSFAYEDDRTNIFKQKNVILGVPFVIAAAIYAVYHLYGFFHATPEPEQTKFTTTTTQQVKASTDSIPRNVITVSYSDYFDEIATIHNLHLSATIENTDGIVTHAIVQALDSHYNLKEQFTIEEIKAFGWSISQKPFGFVLSKEGKTHLARPFPRSDLYGRINETKRNSL